MWLLKKFSSHILSVIPAIAIRGKRRRGEVVKQHPDFLGNDGIDYTDRCFNSITLPGKEVTAKEFYNCTFTGCDFTKTVFLKCKFSDCRFESCNLSLIKVTGTSFFNSLFRNSKILGVNWTQASWPQVKLPSSIQFLNCVISDSTFFGLYLKDIRIRECLARDTDFREADLTGADFAHTDLICSLFVNTDLSRADFTQARNYSIKISENRIKDAKFSMPEAMSLLYCLGIKIT
ncbi:MAG TPA: hypothetical protein DCL44_04335 [Elusimicrobia bacterium]|nr:hypothetical protein [Elusimicrobiota bacterium]